MSSMSNDIVIKGPDLLKTMSMRFLNLNRKKPISAATERWFAKISILQVKNFLRFSRGSNDTALLELRYVLLQIAFWLQPNWQLATPTKVNKFPSLTKCWSRTIACAIYNGSVPDKAFLPIELKMRRPWGGGGVLGA